MVGRLLRIILFSALYLSCLFSAGYVVGFLKGMNTSPVERLVFRFLTCIQPKEAKRQNELVPELAQTASQDLLDKLSNDSRVVTFLDDGRTDWERLIGEKTFNGRGVGWYPSDLTGLFEALGGNVSGGSKWNSAPLDCKNSSLSLNVSNVQRAAPLANIFRIPRSRKPLAPTAVSGNSRPRLDCAFVYVLSRESWEKIVTPDSESMKVRDNIQCWSRDLCNGQVPHDSGRAPNGGPSRASLDVSGNSTSNYRVSKVTEPPARPSWVPRRQDSLLTKSVASQEASITYSALQEPMSPSQAYSSLEHGLVGETLCSPAHYLETVFEVDEDSNLEVETQLNSLPSIANDEYEPAKAHQDTQSSLLDNGFKNVVDQAQESQESSSLFPKFSDLLCLAVALLFCHSLNMAIQRNRWVWERLGWGLEGHLVKFLGIVYGVLCCVFGVGFFVWTLDSFSRFCGILGIWYQAW